MRKSLLKVMVSALAVCCVSSVMAGQFSVWTYEEGGTSQVKVSFAGDQATQDAQVDLQVGAGFEAVSAKVLVDGSVCAISPDKGKIRAVPPSGAGKALASSDVDYCNFTLKRSAGLAKIGTVGPMLKPVMQECAGAVSKECKVQVLDVSEPGRKGKIGRSAHKDLLD